jgi:ubiquinone biosynthesis protein
LTDADRRYIAENLLAFFKRDYRRVALLHIDAGWVDSDTRVDEFEAAIRTVSEPLFEKPLKDISMGQVILNLFRIARSFNLTIQPQLILLQKSLFNIESLGRNLYPELDLWQTAKPYLENWMKEQMGPKMLFKRIKQIVPTWIEKFPEMPGLLHDTLVALRDKPAQATTPAQPEASVRRGKGWLGLSLGLLIGSAVVFAMTPAAQLPGWLLLGCGALSGLIALLRR